MGPTDVTQQQLPFTPPPQVAKNAAGQMVDSTGAPLQAGTISPDKTTLAGGDGGLVWGASGPKMTPQQTTPSQNPSTLTTPASSGGGFFSKLGQVLTAVGPSIGDIGAHLAGGFGNYKPLQEQQAEKEMAIRQEQADLQGKVAQSNLQTQELTRKREQQQIDYARSPEQTAAAQLANAKALEEQKNALGAPKDSTGVSQDGDGIGRYQTVYNPDTHQWETKPMMVGDKQLMAMPKAAGGWSPAIPDPESPTGYSSVLSDAMGNEIGRRKGVLPPAAYVPKVTEGSSTTLKDDGQGNMVPVTLPHSSKTTPTLPGLVGENAPQTKPQIPLASGVPNQGAPPTKPSTGGVKVGGPVMNAKPNADERKRADLAENLNDNLDQLEDIAKRRPELFGPVQGRLTGLKNFIGTDDADVAALENIKHQIGMAQISAHGMRSAQGVEGAANALTNSFHNGAEGMMGAIQSARKSVGTFQKDMSQPAHSRGEGPQAPPTMPSTSPQLTPFEIYQQQKKSRPQ